MSVLETLTEGIRARSLANEGEALLGKWEKTGLLEGLDDNGRSNMTFRASPQLHSQSFAVYSVSFWHKTSCLFNQ